MSFIQRESLRILAAHIGTNVADLTGKVLSEWAGPSVPETMPVCALVGRKFTPAWHNEIPIGGAAPVSLIQFGLVTGTIEIRIGHNTPAQREALQDEVMSLFMAAGASRTAIVRPGVLVLPTAPIVVSGTSTGVTASVAYDLETFEWQEERVFEAARFAFMDITVEMPLIVAREDAYAITDLRLALTRDLTSTLDENLPIDETVSIADGEVTAYP